MARRRMIDPAIWTDEKFGALSLLSKLLFIGLVSNADDEGRGGASPIYIKAVLLPYDTKITADKVKGACEEIASKMNVLFYQDNDTQKTYYQIIKFNDWQTINRPSPSKLPEYDEAVMTRQFNEHSMNTHTQLIPNIKEVKLKEVKGSKDNICRFADTDLFETLWKEYPKIKGSSKQKAKASFNKLKCDDGLLDIIIKAIRQLKESRSWQDGYIPHLATFINQKRWETVGNDNVPTDTEKSPISPQNADSVDIDKLLTEFEAEKSKKGNK